jgi:hypothetical protein
MSTPTETTKGIAYDMEGFADASDACADNPALHERFYGFARRVRSLDAARSSDVSGAVGPFVERRYEGNCPDQTQPLKRDPKCAACVALDGQTGAPAVAEQVRRLRDVAEAAAAHFDDDAANVRFAAGKIAAYDEVLALVDELAGPALARKIDNLAEGKNADGTPRPDADRTAEEGEGA